ncbi:MAG: hypothetical protein EXS32_03925 [Opitutus sp.]|nr:hypothetical protein [Opitutus sp.]
MVRLVCFSATLCALVAALTPPVHAQTATIGGVTISNKGLVGVGRVAADKKDSFKETFGSLSGLALDLRTWQRNASGTYSGTLYTQPDRGYTKSGVTTNYRPRRNRFTFSFKPDTNGSSKQDQLDLTLSETTLYTEANGTSFTSLDPSPTASGTRAGFPALPQAASGLLSLDAEGLALLPDGSFFVSDEYGPYLYRFSASGTLLGAIRPPEALIPKRGSTDSFSSDSPGANQPHPSPLQPIAGRDNNKGLEGLSVSADGRTLYALMQAATRQDGGSGTTSQNRFARLLAYNVTNPAAPTLTGEWILPLPFYTDGSNVQQVAEQHELVALNSRQFLVVASDGNGRGTDIAKSLYRAVLLYDIGPAAGVPAATNLAGTAFDNAAAPIAQNGVLATNLVPATSAVLVDLNDSAQLNKFNLNNSSTSNSDTLASKWESLAIASALDATTPDDYFLFIGNDNDFSTSDGFQDGNSYSASPNVDTMVLVYRVTIPGTSAVPILITQPTSRAANPGQTITFTAAASGSPTLTFQWRKDGVPIANATSATLNLPSVQASDAGSYTVAITNSFGTVTSTSATLSVTNSPVFSIQPKSQEIATGSTVVFSATATGSPAPTYQWRKDGANILGAFAATLVLNSTSAAQEGTYSVVATNSTGSQTSSAVTLRVISTSDPARLINLSVLTSLASRSDSFSLGYVVTGASTTNAKSVVIRAAGPSLGALGFPGTLDDPKLELFAGPTKTGENEDWGGTASITAAMAAVGAFAYVSPTSRDAAVATNIFSSDNSVKITTGANSATGSGAVIAEVYDATPPSGFTATTPRLINFSVIKQISSGGSLTLGFTIGGSTAKTVLIRAVGPGLAAVSVTSGTLGDPQLTLFNSASVSIATNDDWGADVQLTAAGSRVGAFRIGDAPSKDAMLLITLPAGGYTARATGGGNTSGLAIVEVYEVP